MNAKRYLVCSNENCRFVLDTFVNGDSHTVSQVVFKECPECSHSWITLPMPAAAVLNAVGPASEEKMQGDNRNRRAAHRPSMPARKASKVLTA